MASTADAPIAARAATFLPGSRLSLRLRKPLALGLLVLLIASGAAWYGWQWWSVGRFFETTDDAYIGGNVTTLSPHVSGFVRAILVGDNQHVQAGQLLVALDDRDYKAKLAHAQAVVAQRKAALANLHARSGLQAELIRQAAADRDVKLAAAAFSREDAVRYRSLAETRFGSLQNYQKAAAVDHQAAAGVLASEAALKAAKQQLAVLDTETAEAKASLAQADADLRSAQLDLDYTQIRSPIDGYVGDRSAQVGAYAMAGSALLSIVPAHGLWVDANFKEDQLARMRPGQTATFVADVLPGRTFDGSVRSLAPATGAIFSVIPPQNATGNFTKIVQRVPVRIAVDSAGASLGLLRPGLSVTVAVDTRTAPGRDR